MYFIHIVYTIPPLRANYRVRIKAKNKEQAIEQLLKEKPKAKIQKVIW